MNIKRTIITLQITYEHLAYFILFLVTICFLILPALNNGYPLVYSDTGTYIYSGYDKFVPVDRPLGYGLFVYLFGKLISSLWVIIILQATFLIGVSHLLIRMLLPGERTFLTTCLLLITLSFLTGLAHYNCLIIPDIFTSLSLISLAVLLFHNNLFVISKVMLALLIIFSITAHFSILILAFGIVLIFVFISFIKPIRIQKIKLKNFFTVAAILVMGWIAVPLVHYIHGKKFVWERSKNVFIMGRIMESGVLKKYLDDKCPDSKISLCDRRDKMKQYAFQFLWDQSSGLYDSDCLKRGWEDCWVEKNKEYSPILTEIFTTPRYLFPFAVNSFNNSIHQLVTFGIVDMTPMNEDSPVQWLIKKYYPDEFDQYTTTEQSKHKLFYSGENLIQNISVVVSLLIIIFLLIIKSFRNSLSAQTINVIIFLFLGVVLNAFVCATFSEVVDRYEGRIIWIIPTVALIMLMQFWRVRQTK